MGRGRRIRRGSEPTKTANLDGIFTLNECADYIAEDKWPTIPDAVSDLAVTGGDGTLDLSWSAPSSNGLPFSLYIIEYTPSGGSATTVTTSNTSYQITGLTNDTEYSVRVGAVIGDRVNYGAAVTGTPGAVIDLTPLATVSFSSITLENLSSLYPDVYGSAGNGKAYNFQQFGWQLAALEITGGYSPAGPFPIQFGSNAGYVSTTITTATGDRTVALWRLNGYIEIKIDGPCGTRVDVTNIVLEKVTDGVVTHRFGPYSSPAMSTWGCGD